MDVALIEVQPNYFALLCSNMSFCFVLFIQLVIMFIQEEALVTVS